MHRCKRLCEAFLLTTYIEPLESGTPTDRVMTQGPRFAHHDGCQILKNNNSTRKIFVPKEWNCLYG